MASAISISRLTKQFGTTTALDGVSLTIPEGKIFGFLGPNGAGKTTTIRCLMDFIRPTSGKIVIFGKDATRESAELKKRVGYLSSDMELRGSWTARTHINFLGGIKGPGQAEELVKEFNLDLDTKVRNLSSGNKQKLAIILAFLGEPRLLIMDEPTRGLDPLLQNQLYAKLREFARGGGSVFFSSHNLTEVQQLCDSVAVIRQGKIVASETMQNLLKMRVHLIQATAKKAFDEADFAGTDVEVTSRAGKSITLRAKGEIDAVLKALAKYDLTDLEVTHASLEDVFMEYY
jgi:ABC-2 type transport system ATP-binding protein